MKGDSSENETCPKYGMGPFFNYVMVKGCIVCMNLCSKNPFLLLTGVHGQEEVKIHLRNLSMAPIDKNLSNSLH